MATNAVNKDDPQHPTGYRTQGVRVRQAQPRPLTKGAPAGHGAEPPTPWQTTLHSDHLAEETPIALVYNGISHAVMMATPTDLEDFALGFSLAEGILSKASELYSLDITDHGTGGIELKLHIHGARMQALKQQHRTLAGPTGCGLCGKTSLEQTLRPLTRVTPRPLPEAKAVQHALSHMTQRQHLQGLTGAIHAAAWCTPEGNILELREDVGRHNALDKLIGALHRDTVNTDDGFVLMTSRASYELIAKAAQTNLGTLVAVSGATALATDQAQQAGLNLIGFARNGRQVIYHATDNHETDQP